MTTADYLINAVFVLVVLGQARERRVDLRGLLVPLIIVFFVTCNYVHSIPTAGNDLVLVGALLIAGISRPTRDLGRQVLCVQTALPAPSLVLSSAVCVGDEGTVGE